MKTEPEMRFDVPAFIADTMGLTAAEIGSYVLLICDYYMHARPIPNNDKYLRTVCKCSQVEWEERRQALEPLFNVNNGTWHHKRIDRTVAMSIARQVSLAEASAKGVQARRELGQLPPVQPGVSPSVLHISQEKELERVQKRIDALRQQGTTTANGTTYTVPQRAELKTLKDRRDELKRLLGYVA